MMIAGTTIGYGIVAMPIITSGVWFFNSVIFLIYTWFCMLISGLMITESYLNDDSVPNNGNTIKNLLSNNWNIIYNTSIIILLYSLIYTYIDIGTKIFESYIHHATLFNHNLIKLLFSISIGIIILLSTKIIERISVILIIIMIITFIISIHNLINTVSYNIITNSNHIHAKYYPYIFITLPYLVTSFGYHTIIPIIVAEYRNNNKLIYYSLLLGTGISLIFYILWEYVIHGNIPRIVFKTHTLDCSNINCLINYLTHKYIHSNNIEHIINIFLLATIISSLIGVSIGLSNFIINFINYNSYNNRRIQSILLTTVPPMILNVLIPNKYLINIMEITGIYASICTIIIPALLLQASRKKYPNNKQILPGGKILIYFILSYGILIIILQILALWNMLPIY
uniref:Tryptophan permease n=1 Tax=Candidatus Aschnera chinzeii TaxID=1485666 RepID=A0AAT9G4F6_9ENTR|nr:MAG: tryptophan permease [Candidatus Aschnera chinzeii]